MIFKTMRDAAIYKRCCGSWYDTMHIVVPATIDGKRVGWMLQLQNAKR